MAKLTLVGPDADHLGPNTTDESAERGWSFRRLIAAINANFTEIYGQTGLTEVDFGAFPGVSDTSLAVTGQTNIVAGSVVEAWIVYDPTDDHSADEHLADPPRVIAGNISAGIGFTIYAISTGQQLVYGKWTVGWRWQ